MVIEKDGVKYACLPCIRGHRVKKCQHHDRQLAPLSKRGRQVSQCNHCRDLRSSGSHVKCTCASSSVLNRLNGCLCEISQTCTCVARRLQNTQTTTPAAKSDSVVLSTLPYSLPSPSPSVATTTKSTALIQNDISTSNHHSPSLISSFSDPSLFWLPTDLPASSSTNTSDVHSTYDQLHPSTMVAGNNSDSSPLSSSQISLLHNMNHFPSNSSQPFTSASASSTDRDLIDIFLHKDIDDLLF